MAQSEYRAYICCGPNCGPKGSAQLLTVLEDEIARQDMSDRVAVLPTGCQSHCETGPTMVVYPGPVYYQKVDPTRLTRIVVEHFGRGVPVKEYFWTGPYPKRLQVLDRSAYDAGKSLPARGTASQESSHRSKVKRPQPEVDDFKW